MIDPKIINNTKLIINPKLIYEDDSFFVVEKPSGWITNEAGTTTTQPVIQTWMKKNLIYPLNGNREARDGIVHRLDKETSGILLVAKTKDAFEELQRQFKEREVTKTYNALVHGQVLEKEGIINEPVSRLPWRRDRFGVFPDGRNALTNYKVVTKYQLQETKETFTLLELKPKTGRTHQIRIHLKHIGHPIVADEFYAGRKTARKDRKWSKRLFLHAGGITFLHPKTHLKISFESKLPIDLRETLEQLTTLA